VRGEWGEFKNYRDYLDTVNNELVIVPMIETNQSLENLDAFGRVNVDSCLPNVRNRHLSPVAVPPGGGRLT
jgi:2-keto-3-deoxy-L-rhamnonate aldolase RhmA